MYNQLQEHLNKYSILAEEQFGFRSDSTTNKAIYKLINPLNTKLNPICHLLALLGAHPILHISRIRVNETLNALNSKFIVGGIFFNLEKAFDCLNRNILLSKLPFYDVNGKAKSWFESYLHNRYMRVQISDKGLNQTSFSAWEKITDGVPQGSVLCQLLFHVNDLPKTVNNKTVPVLFADDTSIIVKSPNSKDFQTNMVTAFNYVNKWFKANLLSINIDKTHYIQFKTKNKPTLDINIVCDDNLITTLLNSLRPYIKDISNNVKKFEICLKRFLHVHSFYSIEEYL